MNVNYDKGPNDIFYNPLQKPFAFGGNNDSRVTLLDVRGPFKRNINYAKQSSDLLNSTMPNYRVFEKYEPAPNTYRGEKNILMKNWLGHVSSTNLWSNNN